MAELQERLGFISIERKHFALLNLAHHLYKGGETKKLYQLIDTRWRDAHFEYARSTHTFDDRFPASHRFRRRSGAQLFQCHKPPPRLIRRGPARKAACRI